MSDTTEIPAHLEFDSIKLTRDATSSGRVVAEFYLQGNHVFTSNGMYVDFSRGETITIEGIAGSVEVSLSDAV